MTKRVCIFRRSTSAVIVAIVALAVLTTARDIAAREIHYGASTDSVVLECDREHWRGRTDESTRCYGGILENSTSASAKAEAAWALNDLQLANQWFRRALSDSPNDMATKVRWGDLFADSHQDAEAMNIYHEVLAEEPGNSFAKLGAARVLVERFEDAANAQLEALLNDQTTAAGAQAAAWLLTARAALESSHRERALVALGKAEQLLEDTDWPPLDVYALRAAADLLGGVEASQWTELALAYNPRYGGIYATPAHFYVITRRYRGAIKLYQKAIEIEPGLAPAHEALGINLLRDNQMTRARQHLEIAFNEDPFSPRTVNTLRLMDSFEHFRIIDDRPTADGEVPLTLRLHKDEADAIAPYAIELTRRSIAEFTERYGFSLREPVVIEMYPDHEDFAVRTAGMPGLGILGATFGYVIAMDSPSGRPIEQFQWGTTLWHEIAHVFTLEASNHLVPRWFSEGISVFEEWQSGPNPGVQIPLSVYAAIKDERLLPIAELDEGFVRPRYENQVIVSYMQAGLVCHFIESRYSSDKLRQLLFAYRDGMTTTAAIESVIGVRTAEFDELFTNFVSREHATILDNIDTWQQTQALIAGSIAEADWQDVVAKAQQQLQILPQYAQPDSPWLALSKAHRELDNQTAAMAALESFWQNGGYEISSLRQLSEWLDEAGRGDDAIKVLQSIVLVDPLDAELHGTLGDSLLAADRAREALQEFEVAIALKPHDMATAWYRAALAQHQLGARDLSQAHLLRALDVAPNFRPAQKLLLKLADETSH